MVEDANEIVGYGLGALNAKQFYQKLKVAWIPEMCNKYPEKLDFIDDSNISIPQVRSSVHSCYSVLDILVCSHVLQYYVFY